MADSICDYILQKEFSKYVRSKKFDQNSLEDAYLANLAVGDDVDRADEIVNEMRERLGGADKITKFLKRHQAYQPAAELVEKLALPYKTVEERLDVARNLYRTVLVQWRVPPDLAGFESMLKEALEE